MTELVLARKSLREMAAEVQETTGMRVEIIGGTLMMSPTPRGKHFGAVVRLERQLRAHLPDGLTVGQNVSVRAIDGSEDYATPDLIVLPEEFEESEEWLVDPDTVELVVEVVSRGNASKDTGTMPEWYAEQGVPLFLLIDPRHATWTLYSAPGDADAGVRRFRGTLVGKFGESVGLPSPFGVELRTGQLPVYEG